VLSRNRLPTLSVSKSSDGASSIGLFFENCIWNGRDTLAALRDDLYW
jgi:hypothetical protein